MIGSVARALVLLPILLAPLAAQNSSPSTPTITEPSTDGQVVHAADVHMETAPFADGDVGDAHLCTQWEIRTVVGDELAWSAPCAMGPEAVHAHFGDGTFVGAHAGRTELFPETDYVLRARHRDDSGDPVTEWSAFASRPFTTAAATQLFPLELDDIESAPIPTWLDDNGQAVVLPVGAPTAPSLTIEQVGGSPLLTIAAFDGSANTTTDFPLLPDHDVVRVRISSGSLASIALPASALSFTDHEGDDHTMYLPSVAATAGSDAFFWITENGASYVASAGQATPDFTTLARGIPVPWIVHEPGFAVEIVASGFRLPVNIAFVPSPGSAPGDVLYYVAELYGTIRAVTNDGTVHEYTSGLLDFTRTGAFPGSGEQGVTGLAVDPATGDVFAAMLYDAGGPHYPKVVRFTSSDGGITANSATTILDMVGESQGQSHQISNLSIGPDGHLYIHNGDGFDASTAQNLESYRGKILRVALDGTPPTDNPFYDAGNGITARDHVYVYGVRNPFGGAWRVADGARYFVENGPSVDRFARMVEARNYLWSGSDASMSNFALHNWSPATAPVNLAFIESPTFAGSGFPVAFFDHAFVAESGPTWATGPQTRGKKLRRYVIDLAGNLTSGPHDFVEYVGTGKGTAVALAAGPDGLYFSDFYEDSGVNGPTAVGANILRVRYVGFADFTVGNGQGPGPLLVTFTDTSDVPGATNWSWDFGDGTTGSGPIVSHTYTQDGSYDVRLTVTGSAGVQTITKPNAVRVGDERFVAIICGSAPPSASDQAIVDHLTAAGFTVTAFDDEPANRPSAAQLAIDHEVVVMSSTCLSGNVAGEFRTVDVPFIFWESAMLTTAREPLATAGTLAASQNAITIIDGTHPITAGLATGTTTISAAATFSTAVPPFPVGATVLANTATGGNGAIVVADAGATLLGGYTTPARRVFLPYEDSTFLAANTTGRDLIVRAIEWTLDIGGAPEFRRGDCNVDTQHDISDPIFLLIELFGGPGGGTVCVDACDANDDGQLDIADAIAMLGATFGTSAPLPGGGVCGVDATADTLDCSAGGC